MITKQEKFASLIDDHKNILYKVANSYCRNQDDRPDLIQEILIQLWLSFDRFDGRGKFSTWMYRIALNVAISFYRSGKRRIQDAIPLDEPGLKIGVADQLLAEMGDELRLLYQAIGRLDDMNRTLILLYLDGYKHAEIAETTGISETNVATRINRIKQRLQEDLDFMQKKVKETENEI
jgi:RNA polymerase sigma-70 factor (ECF subfamily)